jgi:hypothetical protein
MIRVPTVDISSDLHVQLREFDGERAIQNNIEDRVLAETLRLDGYDDAQLTARFGYVPEPVQRGAKRELPRPRAAGKPRTVDATANNDMPSREAGQGVYKPLSGTVGRGGVYREVGPRGAASAGTAKAALILPAKRTNKTPEGEY